MAAASDTDNEPKPQPFFHDPSVGWTGSGGLVAQETSALRNVRANHEARQQAEGDRQARQQSEADAAKAGQGAEPGIQSAEPLPNTGHGQDRPQGTYEALKSAPSPQGAEFDTGVEPNQPDPTSPAQEGQQSAEQPTAMTARERHEARLQAYLQGDRQEREAAREDVASRFGGADASIKDEQDQGTPGPHLGGGMSR